MTETDRQSKKEQGQTETAIKRLGKLQEDFFEKTGKLYENIELLGNEFYNLMLKDVIEVYKQESKLLLAEVKIDYNAANYKLDCLDDFKSPARFWFFGWRRNEPASLTYREINAQVQEEFRKRTAAIERLEIALKGATENARPDEEPQEPAQQAETAQDGQEPTATDNKAAEARRRARNRPGATANAGHRAEYTINSRKKGC